MVLSLDVKSYGAQKYTMKVVQVILSSCRSVNQVLTNKVEGNMIQMALIS